MLADLRQISGPSRAGAGIRPSALRKASRARHLTLPAAMIVVLVLAWCVWWWCLHGKEIVLGPSWFEFESAKRITLDGNVDLAAISPDAKYVAYVAGSGGNEVLRLRSLPTGSERQLPIATDRYVGL